MAITICSRQCCRFGLSMCNTINIIRVRLIVYIVSCFLARFRVQPQDRGKGERFEAVIEKEKERLQARNEWEVERGRFPSLGRDSSGYPG